MSLNCTSCYSEIENSYIRCPECNSAYHEDCWKRNGYKCSEYGCNGKLNPSENNETNKSIESNNNEKLNTNNPSGTKNLTQPLDENKSQVNIPIKNNNQTIVFLLVIVIVILASYIMFKSNNNQPVQQAVATTQPTQTPLYSSNNSTNSTSTDSMAVENYNPTPEPTVEPTEIYTPTPEPTKEAKTYTQEEIKSLLYNWKQSWENKDLNSYSSYYSMNEFVGYRSSNGELEGPIGYDKWISFKRELFNRYKEIYVDIELLDYKFDNENNTMIVSIRQDFRGLAENANSSYSDSSKKLLVFKLDNDTPIIINEKPI